MPKIVSSSIVSASKDEDDTGSLHIYYCLCGEFLMILDVSIDRLPRRETDGAFILNTKKRTCKLNTTFDKTVIVQRKSEGSMDLGTEADGSSGKRSGFEKQNRQACPKCGLFVCYDQKGVRIFLMER
ncbi:hypothetical protein BDR26DRAFT_177441 [Obelidium mucronatum]|nr:hypothetical protein BDR26DRAFT_177441 [Obelidium mucronatum]